jgi:hypothetical protein
MIFSEQAYKKEIKTLEKNILKEEESLQKEWKALSNVLFSCAKDAEKAAQQQKRCAIIRGLAVLSRGRDQKSMATKSPFIVKAIPKRFRKPL